MCDTMAAVGAATSAGAVLFGKNSDREFDEAQYLQWLPATRHDAGARLRLTYVEIAQARETHAVLLSKPHWIWGAEIGANEHGLVIGNEALFSRIAASSNDGIVGMDYLRLALERARTVDEAIHVITNLLSEHGQGGRCGYTQDLAYHNSFVLADPDGAKVLETVEREWVVTSIENYYAVSNAMTIDASFESSSPTLQACATGAGLYESGAPFTFKSVFEDAGKTASGRYRRARAMALLGARSGCLQPVDFFSFLRDHREGPPFPGKAFGPRICAHAQDHPLGHTTASWVADLTPGKTVHWVTGTAAPCTGLFKPVIFEAGLPGHGPKPGAKEDAATLWWRHDRLRRSLDECGDDIRHAFTEERNALEASFLEAMTKCPGVDDEKARGEAGRIVLTCWRDALTFESRWFDRVVNAGIEQQS